MQCLVWILIFFFPLLFCSLVPVSSVVNIGTHPSEEYRSYQLHNSSFYPQRARSSVLESIRTSLVSSIVALYHCCSLLISRRQAHNRYAQRAPGACYLLSGEAGHWFCLRTHRILLCRTPLGARLLFRGNTLLYHISWPRGGSASDSRRNFQFLRCLHICFAVSVDPCVIKRE